MKRNFLYLFLATGVAVSTLSCKNETKNEVDPAEAKDATEPTTEAINYEIDTTASTIEWKGTKPTGEHVGTIDIQSGQFSAINEEIVSGQVTIDMTSIDVLDEDMEEKDRVSLEQHLKGTVEGKETDFFNVNKFPTATFEVTGIREENGQKFLQGNLTIKEDTKNIEFPVETDIDEEELTLESETFTIDRTDWKVNFGSKSVFDNLGDKFISDDIELTIKVKAERS